MNKLIIMFIFLINFSNLNAQKIDNLIDKSIPNLCKCIEKIENSKKLKIELTNCIHSIKNRLNLNKEELFIYETKIQKKPILKSKIFTALRTECCSFNELFSRYIQQRIFKKTILKSKIDSTITNKYIEGKKLSEYNELLGYISFKVKIEKVEKDNCNFPKYIYVKKNNLKFRVSTFFDKNIIVSDDEYYIFGNIQSSADGIFIQKNNYKKPYVFIHNVINLRTLEMRGLSELY